jgi:hypothetical protein
MTVTRILSYDVGLRNLSHCILSQTIEEDGNKKWEIESWKWVDVFAHAEQGNKIIDDFTLGECCCLVVDYLTKTTDRLLMNVQEQPITHVVIEMQPGKSEKLGSVSYSICAFFRAWFNNAIRDNPDITMPKEFHMYLASNKLNVMADAVVEFFDDDAKQITAKDIRKVEELYNTNIKDQTMVNKRLVAQQVHLILDACSVLTPWKKYFMKISKQAKPYDLCDSLAQAIEKLLQLENVNSDSEEERKEKAKKKKTKKPKKKARRTEPPVNDYEISLVVKD